MGMRTALHPDCLSVSVLLIPVVLVLERGLLQDLLIIVNWWTDWLLSWRVRHRESMVLVVSWSEIDAVVLLVYV